MGQTPSYILLHIKSINRLGYWQSKFFTYDEFLHLRHCKQCELDQMHITVSDLLRNFKCLLIILYFVYGNTISSGIFTRGEGSKLLPLNWVWENYLDPTKNT